MSLQLSFGDLVPSANKYVDYAIEVDVGKPKAPTAYALAVFPWGNSDGTPMASIAFIKSGEKLHFGRRIVGHPAFWAIPKGKCAEVEVCGIGQWQCQRRLKEWLATNAIKCGGDALIPQFQGPASGPDEIEDHFFVRSVNSTGCEISWLDHEANTAGGGGLLLDVAVLVTVCFFAAGFRRWVRATKTRGHTPEQESLLQS